MDIHQFTQSLTGTNPPPSLNVYLQAMWQDGKGNWEAAHELIQDLGDQTAAWLHAYLHREEGDLGNAEYWYRRAGKKKPALSLTEEWEEISTALLAQ